MAVVLPSLYITLGLHMDGAPYPLAPDSGVNGRCYGPNGFLGQLEAWLGLPPFEDIAQSHGQRVALCMRAAGELKDDGAPFYKSSFETAPWATAKRLLLMLDSLLEAGWPGNKRAGKHTPSNLADMKHLYDKLKRLGFQSPSLRFERLHEALEQHPLPEDVKVTLLEKRALWPHLWSVLFDKLDPPKKKEKDEPVISLIPITEWEMPDPTAKGDLGHLQTCLHDLLEKYAGDGKKEKEEGKQRGNGKDSVIVKTEKQAFKGDGSLILLDSDTTDQAAEATALLLRQSQASKDDTLLLLTSDAQALEQGLANFHLPALGSTTATSAASLLQVLPAALRLLWEPLSMEALMDFLLLKITPIGMANANTLVKALNKQPGIGTTKWEGDFVKKDAEDRDAWETAIFTIQDRLKNPDKYYGQKKETGSAEEVDGEKALEKWNSICTWCLPNKTYGEKDGISLGSLTDVCERLRIWAYRCRNTPFYKDNFPGSGNAFAALAGMCTELKLRAEYSGHKSFPKPLLESMLADLPPVSLEGTSPQASSWRTAGHPGQLARPHDTLVWWTFSESANPRDVRRFWSQDELQWLSDNDFELPDLATQHRNDLADFVRTILLTRERCVFILPRRQYGESITPSPWLDVVKNCFKCDAGKSLAVDTDSALKKILAKRDLEKIAPVTTPSLREWAISPRTLKATFEKLNASQLHTYAACPFMTLVGAISHYDKDDFKKTLTFDPADRRSLPDFPIMLGNFAHFLLQELVTHNGNLTPDDAEACMGSLIEQHISAHAAPLDAPDKKGDLSEFRMIMQEAAREIAQRIHDHGLTNPRVEVKKTKKIKELGNIEIEGRADILWQTVDGRTAVWDLKYSDKSKYRKALENNKDEVWQLTAYQKIFPNVAGVAYWLIKANNFCGSPESGISDDEIVTQYEAGKSWDNLLEGLRAMDTAWQKEGSLATAAAALEDAKGDEKENLKKKCKYCGLRFVCGGGYEQK